MHRQRKGAAGAKDEGASEGPEAGSPEAEDAWGIATAIHQQRRPDHLSERCTHLW